MSKFRFYSFVAHHYLSQLQCGLQTAHAVSEMVHKMPSALLPQWMNWARYDKTIIICGAGNHQGVVDCYNRMVQLNDTGPLEQVLPVTLFHEDQQSMNCMATACGILVPARLYEATFVLDTWVSAEGPLTREEKAKIEFLKSYRLA